MERLEAAGFRGFKVSVVTTRQNAGQLDDFKAIADRYGAQLRLTRLRPSGRGADVWDELHPTAAQQRQVYDWLMAHGEQVLTGDSFFHLSAYGESLPGLNLCGAGRIVCLIDPSVTCTPVRSQFTTISSPGTFVSQVGSPVSGGSQICFKSCAGRRGLVPAAAVSSSTHAGEAAWRPVFTGLPLAGPDPECVLGHGERALAGRSGVPAPKPSKDMSRREPTGRPLPVIQTAPVRQCDESPVAGLRPP